MTSSEKHEQSFCDVSTGLPYSILTSKALGRKTTDNNIHNTPGAGAGAGAGAGELLCGRTPMRAALLCGRGAGAPIVDRESMS